MAMTCTVLAFEYFLRKCKSDKVYVGHVYMYVGDVRQTRWVMHQLVICLAKFAQYAKFAHPMHACAQSKSALFQTFQENSFQPGKKRLSNKLVFSEERRHVSRKLVFSQKTRDILRKYFV